ncbi:MAG: hypothetical protein ACRD16_00675 [Thermoanaerobaculia bacterium]
MKFRQIFTAQGILLLCVSSMLGAVPATDPGITLPLAPEKIAPPPGGGSAAGFQSIALRRLESGLYAVRLLPTEPGVDLPSVDLRLLVPRAPKAVRGSESLTRIALIQREFNRNEVHHDLLGGLDFSLANNCLREGLWEVKLARKSGAKSTTLFHAWFTFPRSEYARLFAEVNSVPFAEAEPLFASYPNMEGLSVPLSVLRRVEEARKLDLADLHLRDALQSLPEQQSKRKLVLTPAVASYGDFASAGNQPISTARFSDPGFYNPNDPMRCELSWLSRPTRAESRTVRPAAGGDSAAEVEIEFANGYRILFADSRLASLPARTTVPSAESDVLKIVSGIGTPTIHATEEERARELSEDRLRYLFLLDAKGNLIDNHLAGMDAVYLWRESGKPDLLHIWVVGYERIALIAHFSAPWNL